MIVTSFWSTGASAQDGQTEASSSAHAERPSEPPIAAGASDEQHPQGLEALEQRRFPEAVKIYSEAVAAHPDDAHLHYLLGKAQVRAGDAQHAILTLRTATRLSPSNADYHAELGNAYYAIGALQAARGEYRSAVSLSRGLSNEKTKLWLSRTRLGQHPQPARTPAQPAKKSGTGVTALKATGGILVGLMVVAAVLVLVVAAGDPSLGPTH